MNDLLERQLVEEAVLLAETVGAVEASKNPSAAEEVHREGEGGREGDYSTGQAA